MPKQIRRVLDDEEPEAETVRPGTRTPAMTGRLRATRCRLQEDREMEAIGFLDPVRSALAASRDTRRTIRMKRADDALNSGIFSRMGASFSARSAGRQKLAVGF